MSSLRTCAHAIALAVAGALCTGCTVSPEALRPPSPAELPGVEARYAEDPGDIDTGLLLVAGYREAGRLDEARTLVAALSDLDPQNPGPTLMAGLVAEDSGDWTAALDAYGRFLETGPAAPVREEVERRRERVRTEALRDDVRAALRREQTLTRTPPDPRSVGVFPFVYEGTDPEWEPLALVLADLLTTDLGITGRLSVVERVAVQVLLDELDLGASGRVEPSTAARSGRILGSRHIVQGRMRVDAARRIGIDASLVDVGEPGGENVEPLSASEAIDRFFAMEKQLAFDLYEELGVELTPAERERVSEYQTESIEALLAYGRGLAAYDAGDFDLAQQYFSEAAGIDPSFTLTASRRIQAASMVAAGVREAMTTLARFARFDGLQRDAVLALTNAPTAIQQRVLQSLGQQQRAVLAEILGQDRLGQVILLELVFRGPGGDE